VLPPAAGYWEWTLRRPGRRQFLAGAGVALAVPIASYAQQRTKLFRVGVLIVPSASAFVARTNALRAGLQDLGYLEGKNYKLEVYSADGKPDRLPELAAALVRQDIDVIVAAGSPAIRAAKNATGTIPIVIAAVGDAVAGGFVSNLSRPGANITGSTYFAPELASKQLELLKEAFPTATRIAVISNPNNPATEMTLRVVESSAKALKLELEQFALRGMADAESTFATIAKQRHRVALIIDDPITISNAGALAEQATKHKLASGGNFIEYAEAGGLMAYGVNLVALWRRAASFVDKILKGTSPGEIPVERATRFELVINRRTANAIDVSIAQSILLRADRLIE